jgi:uncharacterized protein (DUF1499 family)
MFTSGNTTNTLISRFIAFALFILWGVVNQGVHSWTSPSTHNNRNCLSLHRQQLLQPAPSSSPQGTTSSSTRLSLSFKQELINDGSEEPRQQQRQVFVSYQDVSSTLRKTITAAKTSIASLFLFPLLLLLFQPFDSIPVAMAAEEEQVVAVGTSSSSSSSTTADNSVDLLTAPPLTSIPPCPRTSGNNNNIGGSGTVGKNCISTASVRQVDLYQPPWTFTASSQEAMARLKGLIASDPKATIIGSTEQTLAVLVQRNLGTDRIDFVINPDDKVVFFTSRRIDDVSGSDFGANRQRLERWQTQVKDFFGVMGQEQDGYGTSGAREGGLGQLKAFYGLQSGAGFQDLLLDDD